MLTLRGLFGECAGGSRRILAFKMLFLLHPHFRVLSMRRIRIGEFTRAPSLLRVKGVKGVY